VGVCNDMRFVVMAGTGFDAALMKAVDDGPKERFGTLAYVWAGVREARRREPLDVRVTVDGFRFYDGLATCVLVGNLGRLKAGVFAFPDASPCDGKLEVGVVSASTALQWLGLAGRLLTRRPQASRRVQLSSGSAVEVEWAPKAAGGKERKAARKMPYELDGGAKGNARKLHYKCEPGALRLLVPAEVHR
jgi:diacylglycerol kinase (ATP)